MEKELLLQVEAAEQIRPDLQHDIRIIFVGNTGDRPIIFGPCKLTDLDLIVLLELG